MWHWFWLWTSHESTQVMWAASALKVPYTTALFAQNSCHTISFTILAKALQSSGQVSIHASMRTKPLIVELPLLRTANWLPCTLSMDWSMGSQHGGGGWGISSRHAALESSTIMWVAGFDSTLLYLSHIPWSRLFIYLLEKFSRDKFSLISPSKSFSLI